MTTFPPLAKSAATEAERQVALAASVRPRAIDHASWDELVARAALRRGGDPRLVLAFAVAFAAGVALVLVVTRPAPLRGPEPGVELVASSAAKWSRSPSGAVVLSAGRLSLARAVDAPVRVETPHVVIEARRSRFLAEVIRSGTSLVVEEGEVVLRSGSMTRVVRAGESVLWPPAPVIPARLLEAPAPAEARCMASPAGARRDCLEAEAATSSLDAQAALYELGVLEAKSGRSDRAVEAWRQSLRRFPDGVLHPEVRLALLVELVRARRVGEAELTAREFEAACPGDPRRAEVGTLKALLSGPSSPDQPRD
jgi:hypothetical protein